jgi:cytochrome c biogenesis protein CcmG/thiol:disulfide interchange protein DsbE
MTRFDKMRLLSLLSALPLICFGILAVLLYQRIFAGDPQTLPSALIGKSVPEFSLPPLEESGVPGLSSKDLQTGRMTLVNVWASWCIPCREDHKFLAMFALLQKTAWPPAQITGINYKDQPQAAQAFLKNFGNPYSRIGVDQTGRAAIEWGVYGVPETFIVDGKGVIVYKHVGPLNLDVLNKEIGPVLMKASHP